MSAVPPPEQITISLYPIRESHLCIEYMKVAVKFCISQTVQWGDERVPLPLTTSFVHEMTVLRGIQQLFIQKLLGVSRQGPRSRDQRQGWRGKRVY